MIKGRGNVLGIPEVDAVVAQGTSLRTTRTRNPTKRTSLSLLSLGEEQSNVPKHCYSISFREVAAPTGALKELAADSELKSEAAFCPRLEPLVEFDLQKESQTC